MLLLSCCSFFSNSLLRSSDYSSLSYSLEVSLVIYCFFSLFDKVSKKKNLDLQYTSHPHNLYLKLTLHFQIASDRSAMIPRRTKYLSPGTTLFYLFPFFFFLYEIKTISFVLMLAISDVNEAGRLPFLRVPQWHINHAPSFSPIINNLISFFLIHPLLSNSKKKGGGAVRQARNLQRALAARRPALSIMISMSMKAPLTPAP